MSYRDDVSESTAEPRAPSIDERLAEILEYVVEIRDRLTRSSQHPTGERHPRALLTERQVRAARDLKKTGISVNEIRTRLGLPTSYTATRAAIVGDSWRCLSDQPLT